MDLIENFNTTEEIREYYRNWDPLYQPYMDFCSKNLELVKSGEPPLSLPAELEKFHRVKEQWLRQWTPLTHREILKNYLWLHYDGRELRSPWGRKWVPEVNRRAEAKAGAAKVSVVDRLKGEIVRTVFLEHLPADITPLSACLLWRKGYGNLVLDVWPACAVISEECVRSGHWYGFEDPESIQLEVGENPPGAAVEPVFDPAESLVDSVEDILRREAVGVGLARFIPESEMPMAGASSSSFDLGVSLEDIGYPVPGWEGEEMHTVVELMDESLNVEEES
jgi:hypothetical protein